MKQVATKATMVMMAAARVARPVQAARAVRAAAMHRGVFFCVEASRVKCVEAKEKQQLGLPKERLQPREEGS